MTDFPIQSPELNELAKALCQAQSSMMSAKSDGTNPHFRSNYATLDSIWQTAREPLSSNGLSVSQTLMPDNVLITTLMHVSGQWLRSYLKLNPTKNDPQGLGSALTYGRRYSLAAIVGIAQADDDGEGASKPVKQPLTEDMVQLVKEMQDNDESSLNIVKALNEQFQNRVFTLDDLKRVA